MFTWSGGPRSSGVGFFCFYALRDKTKETHPTRPESPTPCKQGLNGDCNLYIRNAGMRLVFMLILKLNSIKCIEVGLKHLWKELRLHGLSNNKYKFKGRLQGFYKDKWALIFYLMKVRVRIRDQD